MNHIQTRFNDYIRRFNAQDFTAFEEYLAPDMKMINGTLAFEGIEGMKKHYTKIWNSFSEELHVEKYIGNQTHIAIQMWAHFTALNDDENSLFGPVLKDETFDFRGLIMYDLDENGKFKQIKVAYNTFEFTNKQGNKINLGIPH
jgi:SnoaL-like domain